MGNAMSDSDKVEAIAPSHLSPMDFSGNCNAVTPTRLRMALAHHANCRTFPTCVPRCFCPFLSERLGGVAAGTHVKPWDGSMVGKASQDRRAVPSLCTLNVGLPSLS